jgi:16S rRNA (uracil1498-N3)-methyltransferase
MIRIYLNQELEAGNLLLLDDKIHHYLINVMRSKIGYQILMFNGVDGEFSGIIKEINKKSTSIYIEKKLQEQSFCSDLCLIFAPIKPHRLSFLIEKATELGVTKFIPVITKHTANRDINIDKLLLVAIEASEQSRRLDVPVIEKIQTLDKLLNSWDNKKIILCSEHETSTNIKEITDAHCLMVGPEGGFSSDEIENLVKHPMIKSCSLGERILRAETASIAALSFLNLNRFN